MGQFNEKQYSDYSIDIKTLKPKDYLAKLQEMIDSAEGEDKILLKAKFEGARDMFDINHRRNAAYREKNRERIREYDRQYRTSKKHASEND